MNCSILSRFSYAVVHVPGKLLYTVDTLSRSLSPQTCLSVDELNESSLSMEEFVSSVVAGLPASWRYIDRLKRNTPLAKRF